MQGKLFQTIEKLQNRPEYQAIFKDSTVLVVREDGPILWTNREEEDQQAAYGALMGGAWKAAQTIMELQPSNTTWQRDAFRLSFDTSESGAYILPIGPVKNRLFIGMLFQNEINPGRVKNQFRSFVGQLNSQLIEEDKPEEVGKRDCLFPEISDDEINQLFSTAGV